MTPPDYRKGTCAGCKKFRVLKRRMVHIPNIGMNALSQFEICKKCADNVQHALNSQVVVKE